MDTKEFVCIIAGGLLATVLQVSCFYMNSWARWISVDKKTFCFPLPPPIGCHGESYSKRLEVLTKENTNFALMSLFAACCSILASTIVGLKAAGLFKIPPPTKRSTPDKISLYLFSASALLSIGCCMTATFQISANTKGYQALISSTDVRPIFSSSFYMCAISAVFGLVSGLYLYRTPLAKSALNVEKITGKQQRVEENKELALTIKQHISRDLMYPNDKSGHKMITFSSMLLEMEQIAAEISVRATTKYVNNNDIAESIQKGFQSRFGPNWHCIVGDYFGSAVQHKPNEYIEISLSKCSVLLFRSVRPNKSVEQKTQDYKKNVVE